MYKYKLCLDILQVASAAKQENSLTQQKMMAGSLETKVSTPRMNIGIAVADLILRIFAIVGTLGSAATMGTTDETLPFATQFLQFQAQYDDFGTFRLFIIANARVCGFLALSLPISIYHIVRSQAGNSRVLLIFFDVTTLALLTGGTSAAAAIIYLAHNGNSSANWFAICQQFQDFCQRTSGSLIGSFGAIIAFILLIILSSVALCRH